MADSIRELTEKIYNEGVVKAQAEAEIMLSNAKKEAEEIVEKANQAKSEILLQANREADNIRRKTQSEITLAAQKLMSNLKQNISETLISKQLNSLTEKAFGDEKFVQEMILTVVRNWTKHDHENSELRLLVAPDEKHKIDEFFKTRLVAELNRGVEISPDPNIRNGFKIGPKNGNYVISFTEKDFENYFRSYLKEKTRELIFGPPKED